MLFQELKPQLFDGALKTFESMDEAELLKPDRQDFTLAGGRLLEKTLDRALVTESEHYLVEAVSALAPWVSGNLLQRSLHTIHEINNVQLRVSALVALIPQLEGDERREAVQEVLDTVSMFPIELRVPLSTMEEILSRQNESQSRERLKMLSLMQKMIKDMSKDRTEALSFPQDSVASLLVTVEQEEIRARLLQEISDSTRAVMDHKNSVRRNSILVSIAEYLPDSILEQCLDEVLLLNERGEYDRLLRAS